MNPKMGLERSTMYLNEIKILCGVQENSKCLNPVSSARYWKRFLFVSPK